MTCETLRFFAWRVLPRYIPILCWRGRKTLLNPIIHIQSL